ncbi:Rne/Rng family ribonuclease [Populibacterium corticicola]|uniref:Rne/Rng family ribonuclease n=1 Tax=Populibacterium corticicola TaxID=1812826 RepID=A0ABW5X9M5_9MICO
MTLNDEPTNSAQEPKKPARRRVTRATSAPVIAPVQFLTADTPATSAPKTTAGKATVVTSETTKISDESADTSAPRRSRRVTSSGKATTAAVAVSGTASQIAEQASAANERVAETPAASTGENAAVEQPKGARRRGTSKSGGRAKTESAKAPAANEQTSSESVAQEEPSASVASNTRKRATRKAAVATVEEEATETATGDDSENAAVQPDAKADERDNRARGRSRSTRNVEKSKGDDTGVDSSESPDEQAPTEPAQGRKTQGGRRTRTRNKASDVFSDVRTEQPIKTEPVAEIPQRPRLAATALLFQAPDLSSVPARSVGAQIDPVDEVEEDEEIVEEEAVAEETASKPARTKRERNRNRNRSEDATESDSQDTPEDSGEETADDDASGDEEDSSSPRRRRRRGGRGRRNRSSGSDSNDEQDDATDSEDSADADTSAEASNDNDGDDDEYSSSRRRRRRRRRSSDSDSGTRNPSDEVTALKGSTRLEAKRQRRREGRDAGRRRTIITEAEFLARRESVERSMVVRERNGRTQIAVLEDGVLVEHYVSQQSQASMAGNVYLGRVQNVLPSMEAAFIDIGKGRNAVLYAGEVNWDVHGLDGQPRRIEDALKSGDSVLVQVTKDPIGHKGARLTSQVTLAGRYLVYVPGGGMTGISRKLPEVERTRLKRILREVLPEGSGVIVRTAAEGASEEELTADIARLRNQWDSIQKKAKSANAPALLQGEPDLAIRVVRDIFNDDFTSLKVQGDSVWNEISEYVNELAPDLAERVSKWVGPKDIFSSARIDEQLAKGMDRKVWLPSGGSLVIDRTEAMTVVDVNTGKFTGAGGTLEETVTRNNLEAAEEIVRQLRLRDIGGIIVIDFIDMVLESNRDLVLRRLVECLGRDRTKHQVAEVTSLGLVQMTRKRVGQGLVEAFSTNCEHCNGRGFIVHEEPNEKQGQHAHNNSPAISGEDSGSGSSKRSRRKRNVGKDTESPSAETASNIDGEHEDRDAVKVKLATIAAAAAHAHEVESSVASTDSGRPEESSPAAVEDAAASKEAQGEAKEKSKSSGKKGNGKAKKRSKPKSAPDSVGSTQENAASDATLPQAHGEVAAHTEDSSASKGEEKAAPLIDVLAEFGLKPADGN